MLLNLLSNAFKFTPPDGSIRTGVCADRAPVTARRHLEVADSGPGIAPDRRSEVFERFHRLDGSSTRKMGGTGLGLHIARELVDLHGGSLGVGDAPEGGALFVLDLPVAAPAGTARAVGGPFPLEPASAAVLDRQGMTMHQAGAHTCGEADPGADPDADGATPGDGAPVVLVVEDNPDMNHFVCEALARFVPCVRCAQWQGGARAGPVPAARPHHLRLHDARNERRRTGAGGAGRGAHGHDARSSILTARNDPTARIDVLREGANDYLLKPFFQPELRARVDNLIKVRQAELHLRALHMAEERDRIARDLHDLVIQRVFGAGMRLSAMLPAAQGPMADRLREVVAELDSVINDIRTTIFGLQTDAAVRGGLRAGVRQLAGDAGRAPRLPAPGALRRARRHGGRPRTSREQLLAVLRESLSNVIRHAAATAVEVEVTAGQELVLRVSDDGQGASSDWGRGLRAQEHGLPRRRPRGLVRAGHQHTPWHRAPVAGAPGRLPRRDLNIAP